MAEENIENTDSLNGEPGEQEELETTPEEIDTDDVEDLKEKNRQLFARAKKAEGFVIQDGKWVKKTPKVEPLKKEPTVAPINEDLIAQKIDERFENRELETLDLSDELKKEVRVYAQLNKVSIRKAFDSDYIQFKKNKSDEEAKVEAASLGHTKRGAPSKKDYSQKNPSDFDMTTKEGREEFHEWEKYIAKQLG